MHSYYFAPVILDDTIPGCWRNACFLREIPDDSPSIDITLIVALSVRADWFGRAGILREIIWVFVCIKNTLFVEQASNSSAAGQGTRATITIPFFIEEVAERLVCSLTSGGARIVAAVIQARVVVDQGCGDLP